MFVAIVIAPKRPAFPIIADSLQEFSGRAFKS